MIRRFAWLLLLTVPLLGQTVLNPSAPTNLSIGNIPVILAIELLRAGSGHSHDLELRREVDHVHIRW